jgi:hypothetical protein
LGQPANCTLVLAVPPAAAAASGAACATVRSFAAVFAGSSCTSKSSRASGSGSLCPAAGCGSGTRSIAPSLYRAAAARSARAAATAAGGCSGLGETGPLSQGSQADRNKELRIRHINGMEVRKQRPTGSEGVRVSPLNPLCLSPWLGRRAGEEEGDGRLHESTARSWICRTAAHSQCHKMQPLLA